MMDINVWSVGEDCRCCVCRGEARSGAVSGRAS